ncbi:MAG: hypothetical protein A2849_01290 [Candidatus Taylorbacteria bacterium RIFCSPHIGHO2_01_FULL_51_15]|uniref:Capsule polysaccharide biosynthesis protein n=1 Tax=Candidatus Taylorbacteria bacterium RIFCSPHIGHO2_01_FULL_51_15 TaxID=1802304 RepID=A0A1G2M9H7_9BACT|nr:MAG: hypothetical protein A2849_01290 [Candidatus Taylorbacteria bacterium RIFCSPHIGHO2_01_FULL_51_15]
MRLFLVQWGGEEKELFDVAKELQKSHEIVYWMQSREHFSLLRKDFPNAVFHDVRDALNGIPASGVDTSNFVKVDSNLLKRLLWAESFIMGMITKHHSDFTEAQKLEFYHELLNYWKGMFDVLKPEAIIFPMTPHTAPDFIIYALARLHGIKTLMFYATEVSDRLLFMEDFTAGSALFERTAKEYQGKSFALSDIPPDLHAYYRARAGGNYVTPLSLRLYKKDFKGKNFLLKKGRVLIESLRDLSLFPKAIRYISRQLGSNLKKEYERVSVEPDLTAKFVYLPLQYQPEATTNPLGGIFMDQIRMVKTVSEALPKDWFIYVKEHPSQWGRQTTKFNFFRCKGYYDTLAKFPNVKIVPMNTKTEALSGGCQAVVTNTGTAGWEAALRLKPTITFGYPWYMFCPSVFRVSDVASAKQALTNISRGFKPTEQALINFLAALGHSSIHGYLEAHTKQLSKITKEEATRNISEVLREALIA